jgi:uncharacterized protein (UPF0332 family)
LSQALSQQSYLRKADAALSAARLLLRAQDGDGACNRAYYAMFDAAHAALFALGAEGSTKPIKTHNGVIAKFGQEVVLTGRLPAAHAEDFNKVQRLRKVADYSGDPVSLSEAEWAIEQAEALIAAVRGIIAGLEL